MADNYFNISQHNTMANMYVNIDLRGSQRTVDKVKKTMGQIEGVKKKFEKKMQDEGGFLSWLVGGKGNKIIDFGQSPIMQAVNSLFSAITSGWRAVNGLIMRGVGLMTTRISSFVTGSLKDASDKIKSEVKLKALLGPERFAKFQPQLQAFALNQNPKFKTTSDIGDIRSWAATLIASGMKEDATIPMISRLNDFFGPDRSLMGREIVNLSQILAGDRAYTLDVRQMTSKGVPIFQGIQQALQVPMEDVREAIKNGEVTAEVWMKALKILTDKNGPFYGMVRKFLESTPGQVSLLQSYTKSLREQFGEPLIESFRPLLSAINEMLVTIGPDVKSLGQAMGQVVIDFGAFLKDTGALYGIRSLLSKLTEIMPFVSNFARIFGMQIFGISPSMARAGWTPDLVQANLKIYSNRIFGFLKDVYFKIWQFLKPLLQPFIKDAIDFAADSWKTAGKTMGEAIIDTIKDFSKEKGSLLGLVYGDSFKRKYQNNRALAFLDQYSTSLANMGIGIKYNAPEYTPEQIQKMYQGSGGFNEWYFKTMNEKFDNMFRFTPESAPGAALPPGYGGDKGASVIFNNEMYVDDVSSVLQDQLMAAKFEFALTEGIT